MLKMTSSGNRKKVYIKVIDDARPKNSGPKWIHLCYMNPEIYNAFFETFQIEKADLADFLAKWVKEDWNLILGFTKASDIAILRELVIDKYKKIYPFMYFSGITDYHGWVRVWVSEKMGKEIKRHDKERYKRLFKPTEDHSS